MTDFAEKTRRFLVNFTILKKPLAFLL